MGDFLFYKVNRSKWNNGFCTITQKRYPHPPASPTPHFRNAPNISLVIKARYLGVILIPTHASSQSQMPQSDLLIPYLKYILYFPYRFLCISCFPLIKYFIISDLDLCRSLSLVPHSHSCPSPQQSNPHTTA